MFRLLLCPPDYYGIEYEINPWMDRARKVQPAAARAQWEELRRTFLALNCVVDLVEPQPGLPDMVFTANAGLVVGNAFIRASFCHPQRQGEEKFFEQWFSEHGYDVVRMPRHLIFEGEGDALFCGDVLFCGYHFRSDIQSHQWIGTHLDRLVISVELTDPRFYHLDTCFCPISANAAIWCEDAFDKYAQSAIREHVPDLIPVSSNEALRFACNAVVLEDEIVLPDGCPELTDTLSARGYHCHCLEMSESIKAGGACKCLALLLSRG